MGTRYEDSIAPNLVMVKVQGSKVILKLFPLLGFDDVLKTLFHVFIGRCTLFPTMTHAEHCPINLYTRFIAKMTRVGDANVTEINTPWRSETMAAVPFNLSD